jgi:hypothetical protein
MLYTEIREDYIGKILLYIKQSAKKMVWGLEPVDLGPDPSNKGIPQLAKTCSFIRS